MVALKVFSTFCCCHGHLTEWLTGARCCSWWLICFFFLFWSLCFAFLTDISGFVKTIICFPNLFQDHPFWAGVPLPSLPGTQECHSVLTYGWDCVAFAQRYMECIGMCKQRGPRNLPAQAAQASFQSVEERPWL